MKLEKLDHKHALTSWLKVILFALLMLAPMFSIAVRCLYVVSNKNAKDSYSGKDTQYTQTIINNKNELIINNVYHFDSSVSFTNTTQENSRLIGIADLSNIYSTNTQLHTYLPQASFINFYYSSTNKQLYLYDENESVLYSSNITNNITQFDFRLTTFNESGLTNTSFLSILDFQNNSPLDNAFEYSISKIADSQYYNWTQNTAIYTGVEAMTTGLGITGATIPILITYWFLLTVIYIVIDIVINLFTYITHFLNKKTN